MAGNEYQAIKNLSDSRYCEGKERTSFVHEVCVVKGFSNGKWLEAKLSELLLYSTQGSFCISPFWAQGMQASCDCQLWHVFLSYVVYCMNIYYQLDSVNCFFHITVYPEHYLS